MQSSFDSTSLPENPIDPLVRLSEPQPLQAKDLESIERLIKVGAFRAAAKLYAGAMDCGMRRATSIVKEMRSR